MGERVTCACGRNLGATPRGMIRHHARPDERRNMVRCPWSGRPVAEVAQCMTGATDERIAKLIYAGRSRYPTVLTMDGETTSTGENELQPAHMPGTPRGSAEAIAQYDELRDVHWCPAPTPRVSAAAAGSPGPAKP